MGLRFSPLKSTQHVQKTVSPMETEGIVPNEVSPELHAKDVAAERRKRHFSNSSISSINSDQQVIDTLYAICSNCWVLDCL